MFDESLKPKSQRMVTPNQWDTSKQHSLIPKAFTKKENSGIKTHTINE